MDAGILIVMIVLLALSAFFSATETAFSTFNRIRMKNMAQNGNKRAKLVLKLDEKYDKLINTILIGNNIVNIALSSIATIFFVDLLKNTDESVSATISTAVITVAVLIFGEISPKIIARGHADGVTLGFSYIINAIGYVLLPLSFIFGCWSKLLMLIVKPKNGSAYTEDELITIVDEAEEDGSIETEEGDLIKSVCRCLRRRYPYPSC